MTQVLLQAPHEHALLQCLAEETASRLPVASVSVLLHEEANDELIPKVMRQQVDSIPPDAIEPTIVQRSFLGGESVLVAAPPQGGSDEDSPAAAAAAAVLCVPMPGNDACIGVLLVTWHPDQPAPGKAQLHFLSLLAGIAAVAVEKARSRAVSIQEATARERLLRHHAPGRTDELIANSAEGARLELSRRDVTLLLADVSDFAALADDAPAKEVALVLNRLFAALGDVIFESGGTIDKFLPGSVLAVFGAPWPRDDAAAATVHCAMAMRDAITHLNAGGHFGKHKVGLRIGIHSGSVLAGDVGASRRMDYTVLGSPVNLVSRLVSQVAKAGQIIVGPDTYKAVRDTVECERLGLQLLQGFHDPVWTYAVKAMREQ